MFLRDSSKTALSVPEVRPTAIRLSPPLPPPLAALPLALHFALPFVLPFAFPFALPLADLPVLNVSAGTQTQVASSSTDAPAAAMAPVEDIRFCAVCWPRTL